MKIDYASKMGLHGLMIWAIDLDTPNLEALRSISNGELIGATKTPFSLVDLERIFPAEMLPLTTLKRITLSSTLAATPMLVRSILTRRGSVSSSSRATRLPCLLSRKGRTSRNL